MAFKTSSFVSRSSTFTLLLMLAVTPLISQTYTETEPNNSYAQANSVALPVTVAFSVNPANDYDFFKLNLPVCGVVRVNLFNLAPNQAMRLYAYNETQSQVGYTLSPTNGVGFTYDLLLPSGVSYLRLHDGANNANNMQLKMTLTYDVSDECECNNSFSTACPIDPYGTAYPQFYGENSTLGGDDVDFYKLNLPTCGVVRVKLSNLAAHQALRLYAYNQDQAQIAYELSPTNGVGFTSDLLLPGGITYLKLFDGTNKSDTTHVKMTLTYDVSDECECNNSFSTACPIDPNGTAYPQFYGVNSTLGGDDVDFYKINLTDCGIVHVKLSNLAPHQALRLYVYNEDQEQIAYELSPTNGVGFTADLLLPEGVTYLKLFDGTNMSDTTHVKMSLNYDFCTASDALEALNFRIYPNPVHGEIQWIQLPKNYGETLFLLRDIQGKEVKRMEHTASTIPIPFSVSGIQSGIYWLEMYTSLGVAQKMVLVN